MIRRQLAATNFVNSRIRFLHLRDEGLLKVYRVQKWRRLLFWNQIFPLTLYSRMNMLIRYTYLITFAVSSLECFIHIKYKYSTVYTLYSIFLSNTIKGTLSASVSHTSLQNDVYGGVEPWWLKGKSLVTKWKSQKYIHKIFLKTQNTSENIYKLFF